LAKVWNEDAATYYMRKDNKDDSDRDRKKKPGNYKGIRKGAREEFNRVPRSKHTYVYGLIYSPCNNHLYNTPPRNILETVPPSYYVLN
jgi:hypothetical protein